MTRWSHHAGLPSTGAGLRILHVATRFLSGGSERNLAHFVDWEVSAGYDVEVALGRASRSRSFPRDVRVHHVGALVRSLNPLQDVAALAGLRSLMRAGRFDMVHTHLSKAGILGRVAGRGTTRRIVHTVHMPSFGAGYNPIASIGFQLAERYCASFSDALAFVGDELRARYERSGIGVPARMVVIRSPIDVGGFLATRSWGSTERMEARRRIDIPMDAPLLLALGALEERKRYRLMLNELTPLLRSREARLAIAGDGEKRSLQRLAHSRKVSDRVHLLGHVDDVAAVLASADLLVHTSSVEGVPQVVLQALAAGKAVVATDVMGLRELGGSRVTIVPSSGRGLMDAVSSTMKAPPAPLPAAAFEPWTCPAIDAKIAAFHSHFDPGR